MLSTTFSWLDAYPAGVAMLISTICLLWALLWLVVPFMIYSGQANMARLLDEVQKEAKRSEQRSQMLTAQLNAAVGELVAMRQALAGATVDRE